MRVNRRHSGKRTQQFSVCSSIHKGAERVTICQNESRSSKWQLCLKDTVEISVVWTLFLQWCPPGVMGDKGRKCPGLCLSTNIWLADRCWIIPRSLEGGRLRSSVPRTAWHSLSQEVWGYPGKEGSQLGRMAADAVLALDLTDDLTIFRHIDLHGGTLRGPLQDMDLRDLHRAKERAA